MATDTADVGSGMNLGLDTGVDYTSRTMDTPYRQGSVGFIGGKFLPLHMGHIYAILSASNYVDELYVVLSSSKNRDRELCERDGIKYIPPEVRLSWLGKEFNNIENIRIIHIEDDEWDSNYDWENGAKMIKEKIGKHIDYVFSSEKSYDVHFKKYYPDAKHVVIDDERKAVNISATELRKDLYTHWDMIPESVQEYFTKKVLIIGTESCGKSTLVKKLAKIYHTNFVHEIGRDYCERYSDRLTPDMFDNIAMEHYIMQYKKLAQSNKILFIDSDATTTQFYLDMYFNKNKSQLIEEIIKLQNYDLAIYLEPDVKWVNDGLRSAGADDVRQSNNAIMKAMFEERGIRFVSVSGTYYQRFRKSKSLVDKLFEKP